ncbi:MAG: hypothetical protein ACRC9X_02295 [Bacteroidales bacterium]
MKTSRTFADKMNAAQIMSAGLHNHVTEVAKMGWDEEQTTLFDEIRSAAIKFNDEQERIKAQLKLKTEELDSQIKQLDELYSRVVKIIKLAFPQKQWVEFGIHATR